MEILIGVILYLIFFGFLGNYLGAMRRRSFEGMWLGILLGPIGCIIALLMPEGKEEVNRSYDQGQGLSWRKTKEGQDYAKRKRK